MKNILLAISILLFGLLGNFGEAQTLSPVVVNTDGDDVLAGDLTVSYSIGEPIIDTRISEDIIVTQGFLQPDSYGCGFDVFDI